MGRWARKPVNHTSWVALVTPTDRPKSVRNPCLIELFCGVVCVVTLPFWHFCWCRGFCHRTESDLFLFLFYSYDDPRDYRKQTTEPILGTPILGMAILGTNTLQPLLQCHAFPWCVRLSSNILGFVSVDLIGECNQVISEYIIYFNLTIYCTIAVLPLYSLRCWYGVKQ